MLMGFLFSYVYILICFINTIFKEFYLKRLHQLISDFLILMPIKIKELRQRADETSRTIQMYAQVKRKHILIKITISKLITSIIFSFIRLYG